MARQRGTDSVEEPENVVDATDDVAGVDAVDEVDVADDADDADDVEGLDAVGAADDPAATAGDSGRDAARGERSADTDAFWAEVRVEPVEIALRDGVGYTLRAYRLSSELTPPQIGERVDEFDLRRAGLDPELVEIDEEELERQALAAGRRSEGARRSTRRTDDEDDDLDAEDLDAEDVDDEDNLDEADGDEDTDEDEDDEAVGHDDDGPAEEVPVFLGRPGRLYLFRSPEGLVEFVRSDEPHELTQLDTWAKVRERITVQDVVPQADDVYELDLVVSNLRGGHDAWDPALIIQAGEAARDIAYSLRLESVINAVSAGSSLDELDEALRDAEAGGIGGFFARRRVRRIGAEAAAIGWRTIIGKISAAVDWRD